MLITHKKTGTKWNVLRACSISLQAVRIGTACALRAAVTNSVTTTSDSGPGSLRQAILDQNVAGGGRILISTPNDLTLSSELPEIRAGTFIDAVGSDLVTLSGSNRFRVLSAASNAIVTLRRLRNTGGNATDGPGGEGIQHRWQCEPRHLMNCWLHSHQARGRPLLNRFVGWPVAQAKSGIVEPAMEIICMETRSVCT